MGNQNTKHWNNGINIGLEWNTGQLEHGNKRIMENTGKLGTGILENIGQQIIGMLDKTGYTGAMEYWTGLRNSNT
ncbi:hypothetical protein Glove_29g6 [Diversispora epigaea]|uniref:Uncharacterized protein n=1 Tax=Diversispora epigaea TaxID=1348612 RepID=A0A397JHM3_9GLOM|nr:hypothetical protein Glove_29g6 [Diversispora epigaea]